MFNPISLEDEGFIHMVKEKWMEMWEAIRDSPMLSLMSKLNRLKSIVIKWKWRGNSTCERNCFKLQGNWKGFTLNTLVVLC